MSGRPQQGSNGQQSRLWFRWGIREKLIGVVLAVVAVILLLTGFLFETLSEVAEVEHEATRVSQRIRWMDKVVKLAVDMETGVRGFVLTGNEEFLEPYHSGDAEIYGLLETLRLDAALRSGEGQLERVEQVAVLLDTWRMRVATPLIDLRRGDDVASATDLVASGRGKVLTDAIRAAASAYVTGETARLEQRREHAEVAREDALRQFVMGASAAAVAALLALGIFGLGLTRTLRELSASASAMTTGEWSVQVDESRRDELGDVARAFNMMAQQVTVQATELAAQNEELIAQQDSLEHSYRQLEDREASTKALFDFASEIAGTVKLDDLSRTILHRYLALYQTEAGAVYVLDGPDAQRYRLIAQSGLTPSLLGQVVQLDEGPVGRCAQQREPLTFRYPETGMRVPIYGEELPVQAEVCIPMVHLGQAVAVIVLGLTSVRPIPESTWQQAASMSVQGAMAVAGALVYREVERHLVAVREHAAVVEDLNTALEDEKRRANEQRDTYLSIITNIKSAACLVDDDNRVVLTNPSFCRFFGFTVPPESGTPVPDVMKEALPFASNPEEFARTVRDYFEQPVADESGKIETTRDGKKSVLHWYVVPVQGVGRLFIFRDNTVLEEIDRMKTEFISTVSHELRTPLTSILGYVDLILEGDAGETNELQREFLGIVHKNTCRLKELINDLLDIERIESGRIQVDMETIDFREVVGQVAKTFEVSAQQKGLDFQVVLADGPVPVIGDYNRLVQLVSNLVSNAVKYTREGTVTVRLAEAAPMVRLDVADTGIGMTEKDVAQLFTKFFRADNSYTREVGGTGLGLSIVKALLVEHGGHIEVESAPGKGSTFTVRLPLAVV